MIIPGREIKKEACKMARAKKTEAEKTAKAVETVRMLQAMRQARAAEAAAQTVEEPKAETAQAVEEPKAETTQTVEEPAAAKTETVEKPTAKAETVEVGKAAKRGAKKEKGAAAQNAEAEQIARDAQEACAACSSGRTVVRDEETKQRLSNRLARLEGQVRGIRGMIERDAYCTDVLVQASAASAALRAFEKSLLEAHMRGCVAEELREGRRDVLDELVDTINRLLH